MKREYDFSRARRAPERALPPKEERSKTTKVRITIMLDQEILRHFKDNASLPGAEPYQRQINNALRDYVKTRPKDLTTDPRKDPPSGWKGSQVLADHAHVGKRFVPPLVKMSGPWRDIHWVDQPLPELLWLGLLNEQYGLQVGAALGLLTARSAAKAAGRKRCFAITSAYSSLTEDERVSIVQSLRSAGALRRIRGALASLVGLYPACPFRFLYENQVAELETAATNSASFKRDLELFFNRYDKPATLMQANAIYIAFATDLLRVAKDTALASFPKISEYPATDISRRVGAAVRATVNVFFGEESGYESSPTWPRYFWNRGLEIEPCSHPPGTHGGVARNAN